MRNKLLAIAVLAAGAAAVTLAICWPYPEIAPISSHTSVPGNESTLRRGAEVVALGDCMVCHTNKAGAEYAGGLALKTPFGAIYTTNITPDRETGIGDWSLEAFTRAVRHGVSRDGHLLYPAFPYIHYTQMTDEDIGAAYAYLMSRTPINSKPPANELILPLRFRPFLAFWNFLYLKPGNQISSAAQSSPQVRGHYLVDSLGHCASCHSGLNPIGGESKPAFSGGVIDGWEAPALTSLTQAPVPWNQQQLEDYLSTGLSKDHGTAKGPMQPVTAHLSEVPPNEVQAISAYIMSLQAGNRVSSIVTATENKQETISSKETDRMQQGAALFSAACASCHDGSAPMSTVIARPGLQMSRSTTAENPTNFIQTVLEGIPLLHSPAQVYMPAFADVFTDDQLVSLAAYVRGEVAKRPAWPQLDKKVAQIRKGE